MSKYYSSILEIICGNFCRNFCNHFFRWSFELAEQEKKKRVCVCHGSWYPETFVGGVLPPNISCTVWLHTSYFKYLDRKHTMLNNSASYKTSVAGKRKRAQSRIALGEKKIQPGTCVDDFGTGVYLSSGKGLLLAMSDIVAEK